MVNITYVYPSMSQPAGQFRGGLLSRWEEAAHLGCKYLEIPGNFIKHPKEEEATGLGMCEMLTPEAIDILYTGSENPPDDIEYIFHTDPSFPQTDRYGVPQPAADLRWHDQAWLQQFCAMLVAISKHLGKPASIIEIHPGSNPDVTPKDIARAIGLIYRTYGDSFGRAYPRVVLENRNISNIEEGRDLLAFWEAMEDLVPELCESCGIVLDLSVLFNVSRRKGDSYQEYLDYVPLEGVKGIHVHTKHGAPSLEDDVPWEIAFEKVGQIPHDFFVNPEIHHKHRVAYTIGFVEEMLRKR